MPPPKGPRKKGNRKRWTHLCEWCGQKFLCARPDAQCCTDQHRLKLHRWKKAYLKHFGFEASVNPRGDNERQRWFEPVL
jgi:hypothetical protein